VVTPFQEDPARNYPLDDPALRRYIDYLLDGGAKVIMVASATSRFAQLEESEIRTINQVVVDQVGDRGLAISSTGILGSTRVHTETAQQAETDGAAAIACEYPWRYQSTAALVAYFEELVESTNAIGIMLHVTPGRSELGGQYRYNVEDLQEILRLPRVIGMKEAAGDPDISRSIWEHLADQTSIIVAGRGMVSYYEAHSYRVSGYFVGTGNLVPKHDIEFYSLMQEGNLQAANRIVQRYELPFLHAAKGFGWHAALKAGLAELGIMNDCERPPMVPIPRQQRAELAVIMKIAGWLD
jgi:4-hydroxy-tetrahydrodipicolinate synthase